MSANQKYAWLGYLENLSTVHFLINIKSLKFYYYLSEINQFIQIKICVFSSALLNAIKFFSVKTKSFEGGMDKNNNKLKIWFSMLLTEK